MNVTGVPSQIIFPGFAEMLTLAATLGFTVITIAFDVAEFPVTQIALEVSTHVIEFPFANPEVVNVGLSVPTSVIPFFH